MPGFSLRYSSLKLSDPSLDQEYSELHLIWQQESCAYRYLFNLTQILSLVMLKQTVNCVCWRMSYKLGNIHPGAAGRLVHRLLT
jgi:hypothetical protein